LHQILVTPFLWLLIENIVRKSSVLSSMPPLSTTLHRILSVNQHNVPYSLAPDDCSELVAMLHNDLF
ncbi:MAG: hypothetical protein ACK54D_05330, partial [Pseudanabaena sp.]